MELLRAKSDEKKVIFRKLFGTGIFEDIVTELSRRLGEHKTEMAKIRTICQTEVSHIRMPEKPGGGLGAEGPESTEETEAAGKAEEEQTMLLRDRILRADRLSVTDMEALLEALKAVCERLGEEEDALKARVSESARSRDAKRDALTEAKNLLSYYMQQEKARAVLAECAEAEPEIKEKEQLAAAIAAAWEIRAVYRRYEDSLRAERDTAGKLAQEKEALPGLQNTAETAEKEEQKAGKDLDAAKEQEARTEERTLRAEEYLNGLADARRDLIRQEKQVQKAVGGAEQAKAAFYEKNEEYARKQSAFLNAQAGYLAAGLVPGKPCPVCGSTEHPHPCILEEEAEKLTREQVESLGREAGELQQQWQKLWTAAAAAAELLEERKKTQASKAEEFLLWAGENFPELLGGENLSELPAGENLPELPAGENLPELGRGDPSAKAELPAFLQEEDTVRNLREKAESIRSRAEKNTARKDKEYRGLLRKAQTAKTAAENTLALIQRYEKDLPELQKETEKRRKEYENILTEMEPLLRTPQETAEERWQALTLQHEKTEPDHLRKEVSSFREKRAGAAASLNTAAEGISGRPKPDMEALQEAYGKAEEKLTALQEQLNGLQEVLRGNDAAYRGLAPAMEQRKKVVEEYQRTERLYSLLAGKVSGSRMDIETFAQRYYLERILESANLRFQEMSAGQFELRMYDLDRAGEGKNRGLDLMVYSTVTGKVREVRTLSGGESFMAALSLALGMADQIQERSSAIHLDVMFIDEGFGSLDDHAREQAVKVLMRMAGGSRLIGIISHVTELKQEIEDQLIVEKGEEGSRVRWQIS
ncbi:MAG: SMC family ATPase [Clostridium sp.]|nr:SMC family ATPase [Clostridium sp.]